MNKKIKRLIWIIVLGSAFTILVGWFATQYVASSKAPESLEQEYWGQCVEENTDLSYSRYILHFPKGKHIDEAKKKLEEFNQQKED